MHIPGPHPQRFDSGGLQQSLSICIPNKLPSDANVLVQDHSESTDTKDPVAWGKGTEAHHQSRWLQERQTSERKQKIALRETQETL